MRKKFSEVEQMYRHYKSECESMKSCCAVLNRDGGDVMMSCIGQSDNAYHFEPITISRDDFEDIKEYSRFIGCGFDYSPLTIIDD